MAFQLKLLASDARTLEHRVWSKWMKSATALASRFHDEVSEDDPFSYNETASVSHLTAAAAKAGYLALAEFGTTKKSASNRRQNARGRADLWMIAEGRSWAFEFKQINDGWATAGNLKNRMEDAIACAKRIKEREADHAVAGMIVPIQFSDDPASSKARLALQEMASECHYAWRIHGATSGSETYLFFKFWR